MTGSWLLSVLRFGFVADAALCAASLSHALPIGNLIPIILASSFVLRLNAALWRVFSARFSLIPYLSLSTSAAL
jgi:hypothetical protein